MIKSLAIVVVVAATIAFAIVLPAEYGRDPTGVGQLLGLKEMGDIKMALAKEASDHAAADSALPGTLSRPGAGAMFDSSDMIVPPGQTRGLMLELEDDASVRFRWSTKGGAVSSDMHAESPTVSYRGYSKNSDMVADSGTIAAAFTGLHGWAWSNRGSDTVVVSLRVIGQFTELKRVP